tara:strand:+ start:99 stop:575 length:477 start_codon:yes stop_codon:yes gene_type:complete
MPYIWTETQSLVSKRGFTHEGIQYPAQWLGATTAEQQASIGIEWVEDDRPKVSRKYYHIRGDRGDWTTEPRDLDELKARAITDCKERANSRLNSTDWYVVRHAEIGSEIPADVAEFRAATRTYSNTLEAEIEAADFEGIQKIKQEWPKTAAEEGSSAG